jgi:hypothetical protein
MGKTAAHVGVIKAVTFMLLHTLGTPLETGKASRQLWRLTGRSMHHHVAFESKLLAETETETESRSLCARPRAERAVCGKHAGESRGPQ